MEEIELVNVDMTVQEKAIAFPTEARLYEKAFSTVEELSQVTPEL